MNNLMALYKSKSGEIRNYNGWETYARHYYNITHELDISYVTLPDDWMTRMTDMLHLQLVGAH